MPAHASSCGAARKTLSVQEIFRLHGPTFLRAQPLSSSQRKVVTSILQCRTPALGGEVQVCDTCGYRHVVFHSCRDRHCPTCQALAQTRWVASRMQRVLPVPAFHVVFTLPSELRRLARYNARLVYDILFDAASSTLRTLAAQRMGAELGITAVLHTWNRRMQLHPHLHCIVTAGGLALDRSRWVEGDPDYLFPVHVMGSLFRGKFLAALKRARKKLVLDSHLAGRGEWKRLVDGLYRRSWVVYAKRPFSGAEHVYAYLGRYTHRVAISSARIKAVTEKYVRFRTRGDDCVEVTPAEFIRRFLRHVLPKGFRKIRHYGLYAPGPGPRDRRVHVLNLLEATRHPNAPAPRSSEWAVLGQQLVAALRTCPSCSEGLLIPIPEVLQPGVAPHPDDDTRLRPSDTS